jgi:hypothetical protein
MNALRGNWGLQDVTDAETLEGFYTAVERFLRQHVIFAWLGFATPSHLC